jgi:hypothetical protein
MRLIDADAINKYLKENKMKRIMLIDTSPTVDAVQVVHAYWIPEKDPEGKTYAYHCSECYEKTGHYVYGTSNYCPDCGAKMDGEYYDN